MIKKALTLTTIFLLLCSLIQSCNDDESLNVDSTPEFTSLVSTVSSLPGQTFLFEGVVSDEAGVRSVNLKYEPWFLNKTIIRDSITETYELSYKFKVPDDAIENSVHVIPLTITNIGGKSSVEEVTVTLDQDIDGPQIQIAQPINEATLPIGDGDEISFDVTVTDAELAELKIESDLLNEVLPISGTSYNYTNSLDVAIPDKYFFTITATDVSGNVSTETFAVNVVDELEFTNMYVTDMTSDTELVSDIFGVPYKTSASSETNETGYVFTARYYAPTPNFEVRFLAQKGSFSPYAFGAGADSGRLAIGSSSDVAPIVLSEVGYYEIKMDLRDLTYSITPYTPSDDTFEQVYIIGTGIYINETESTCTNNTDGSLQCWNFASGKPFQKDGNNPYLWTIDVSLKDEPLNNGANGFILNANPNGWSPFWRIDNPNDPEATVPGGGVNYVFPDSALDKEYRFVFDTHLNRIAALPR
ncbi:cadherin repeat domain-containing protein [Spongiivirga citrea]|uniref:Cadherin domain-containing protein n=1 Tax=Spongiivirga citrea TaxID=1481457 RepID=A0A6M0CVS6_9FLAO|nr:hypothetical protein [Spongiivirga citrea]NER17870.1 hypothetical protein [Spongiivirga citrea]